MSRDKRERETNGMTLYEPRGLITTAKFKSYPWWPTSWDSVAAKAPTAGEISATGSFESCMGSDVGLTIVGLCDINTRFSAIIPHSAGVDLEQLERILDSCRGLRMSMMENLDVEIMALPGIPAIALRSPRPFAVDGNDRH
jgi:hypothetical protein